MLKKILFVISAAIIITSCVSSGKLLQEGRYNDSITKAIKKLRKNPSDREETAILRKAVKLADKYDLQTIQSLKLSGQPSIWETVYQHYVNLSQRQERISRLPNGILSRINFKPVNYMIQEAYAKRKAADYFDAKGVSLLNHGDRFAARNAWKYFQKEAQLFPDTPGLNSKINTAIQQGTSRILFTVQNKSHQNLPKGLKKRLKKLNFNKLNRQWLQFSTQFPENQDIDYVVALNIRNLTVSPELIDRNNFREEKKIEDGWKYVLDKRGNIKKDSAGNDIKTPKYHMIHCSIKRIHLTKSAQITGTISYYDNHTGKLIKTRPIASQFTFDYRFATATGNLHAADEKSKELLSHPPLPFPADFKMIYDVSNALKKTTFSYLEMDSRLFQ